uniref:Uncharacterized protein n=1 Tax=Nelumbo nucifera TaxID=4432 RepID=A0A822XKW2_NELNU|nr:TPA_asm: hypothetical protein HUJ06_023707 [Nelumbo nucifera]
MEDKGGEKSSIVISLIENSGGIVFDP